jgi:hypothetical protein
VNKSYTQKAIEAVRGIPHDARRAYLWEFPPEDLEAYQAMPDVPQLKDHDDYLARIAGIQADLEHRGIRVFRVRFSAATMLAELEKHGWPNDTQHRTKVTGELGAKQYRGTNEEIGR